MIKEVSTKLTDLIDKLNTVSDDEEVDVCMFGRNISVFSYVISALITYGFSILVNGVMYFKLKKIDMVESLKSVE